VGAQTPAPGVVPYGVRSPLWSDGTIKRRFVALPPGETAEVTDEGPWSLPDGTVLLKTFILERVAGDASTRRALETRMMVRRSGTWDFHSYRWDDSGMDAALREPLSSDVEEIEVETGEGRRIVRYQFPSREGCDACHGSAPGRVLGPRTDQLNGPFDYGEVRANQLVALTEAGYLDRPVDDPDAWARLPDPADPRAPLEDRARSWLFANCGHCHQPGGFTAADLELDLRYGTAFAEQHLCLEPRRYYGGELGDHLVEPGDPGASTILLRMRRTDLLRMPPIGVSVLDEQADQLLDDWIASMDGCPP
jgi:uncharacterized repeat protein (TIGR03806 family)